LLEALIKKFKENEESPENDEEGNPKDIFSKE
jgi:hypothetical protein